MTEKPKAERKLELSPDMAIWIVPLDNITERDKNARVMEPDKFKQLIENIADEGMLESLPLVHKTGEDTFEIISGHHRVRAARVAKMVTIPVIAIERDMTESEIASKQLSHNAISGYDDKDLLNEIYASIEDLSWRIKTALTDEELKIEEPNVPLLDIDIEFGYETIYILFTKPQVDRFTDMVERLDEDGQKYLADYREFREFRDTVQDVSERYNIRNIAGIMSKIVELAEERLEELGEEEAKDE